VAITPFTARVLNAVRRIPPGRVCTYGGIARLAGRPLAWRAVGNIMSQCGAPGTPCHRVVASGGRLGGFGGNPAMKRALLAAEGVIVSNGRIREWRILTWPDAKPAPGTRNSNAAKSVSPRRRRPRN
jgi:methylated-DNA-[protein]-cysteine S-methyltransferase